MTEVYVKCITVLMCTLLISTTCRSVADNLTIVKIENCAPKEQVFEWKFEPSPNELNSIPDGSISEG